MAMAIAKFNKIYHGSEKPFEHRDLVLEAVEKAHDYNLPAVFAKSNFLKEKAKRRLLANNANYRNLEKKITGGAYRLSSMENRY